MILCFPILKYFSAFIATPFINNPKVLLILVMICCPVFMNIIQFIIQDQFLKDRKKNSIIKFNFNEDLLSNNISINNNAINNKLKHKHFSINNDDEMKYNENNYYTIKEKTLI